MANHGPFTIGRDARAAVKAAVMRRGRRPHRAHRPPARRAARRSTRRDIDALYDRYQNVYGQTELPEGATLMTSPSAPAEVWFLTGSQGLYGEET